MAGTNVIVSELPSDPKPSPLQSTSPSALDAVAGWATEDRGLWRWARFLPVITGIAAALILGAVAFRLWLAPAGPARPGARGAAPLPLANLAVPRPPPLRPNPPPHS